MVVKARGKKGRYTIEDKVAMVKLYMNGATLEEVGKIFGCTREYVRQIGSSLVGYPIGTVYRVNDRSSLLTDDEKTKVIIRDYVRQLEELKEKYNESQKRVASLIGYYARQLGKSRAYMERVSYGKIKK